MFLNTTPEFLISVYKCSFNIWQRWFALICLDFLTFHGFILQSWGDLTDPEGHGDGGLGGAAPTIFTFYTLSNLCIFLGKLLWWEMCPIDYPDHWRMASRGASFLGQVMNRCYSILMSDLIVLRVNRNIENQTCLNIPTWKLFNN